MYQIKIDDFEGDDGELFPEFSSLNDTEMMHHQNKLKNAFKCPESMQILDVFKKMIVNSIVVSNINAEDDSFCFSDLLSSQGISSKKKVYIDWHRFDDIDFIELSLLTKYFDDIWYPSVDDIYIYDDSFSWFALVTHHGTVTINRSLIK